MTMCAINQPQPDKAYFTLTAQSCMGALELVPTTENGCVQAKQEFERKLALLIRLDDVMADLNGRIAWPIPFNLSFHRRRCWEEVAASNEQLCSLSAEKFSELLPRRDEPTADLHARIASPFRSDLSLQTWRLWKQMGAINTELRRLDAEESERRHNAEEAREKAKLIQAGESAQEDLLTDEIWTGRNNVDRPILMNNSENAQENGDESAPEIGASDQAALDHASMATMPVNLIPQATNQVGVQPPMTTVTQCTLD
jgi:hypothetical protein